MFNKVYEKIKKFIRDWWKSIVILVVSYFVLTYPVPYYIYTGGGTININDRVEVAGAASSEGSLNFAYVSELEGNVATFLLAHLIPSWDLEEEESYQLSEKETVEDIAMRNHLYLENANQTAILVAFQKAKQEITIKDQHLYILYLDENSNTTLKVGDEILSVDGQTFTSTEEYSNYITSQEVGTVVTFQVLRDEEEMEATAEVKDYDGKNLTGISLTTIYEFETDPKVSLHFKASESGPSGGLMLTLAIYDKLVEEDITHGKKIVGTGTIAADGSVGEIGGVKYKLSGAVKSKADLFLVPAGDNYEEAKAEKEKNNYDIEIKAVSTFEEALEILEEQ